MPMSVTIFEINMPEIVKKKKKYGKEQQLLLKGADNLIQFIKSNF